MAQKLGVCEPSIYNWENHLTKPALRYIPMIIKFIEYVPFDKSTKSIGEKIVVYRKLLGLNQKRLAHQLGVDPSTLSKWEKNKRQPPKKLLKDLTTIFKPYPSGV